MEQHRFAIFGSFSALSAAELFAVFGKDPKAFASMQASGAIVRSALPKPLAHFGGIVKTGDVLARFGSWDQAKAQLAEPAFVRRFLPPRSGSRAADGSFCPGQGKVLLGVSVYDPTQSERAIREQTRRVGRLLKGAVSRPGGTARWVESRERTLSSVVVATNRLLDRGAETVLFRDGNQWWLGRTTAVQDFRGYGRRDYGRPARDDASGLLPPKLAQIILNLSGASAEGAEGTAPLLLDPFCGSGTVLMEALLAGFREVFGSDKSIEAVRAAEKNLSWLKERGQLPPKATWHVAQADVRQIDRAFPRERFSTIVTEPFLGPQRGFRREDLSHVAAELTALYRDAFRAFARAFTPGGKVAIVFPAFFLGGEPRLLPAADIAGDGFTLVPLLPPTWSPVFPEAGSARRSILYRRPGQKVGREIFVFKRV